MKEKNRYGYLFLAAGILTSFFDFLTYPIITLGVPLGLFLFGQEDDGIRERLKMLITAVFSWGMGYAGMWIGKWLMASLILKRNVFADAFSQAAMRTSMTNVGEKVTIFQVVRKNVMVLCNWPYLFLFAAFAAVLFLLIRSGGLRTGWKQWAADSIPYFLIACMPFVWYIFASNHSVEHYWFTYRALAVTVFVLAGALLRLPGKKRLKKRNQGSIPHAI